MKEHYTFCSLPLNNIKILTLKGFRDQGYLGEAAEKLRFSNMI